MAEPAASVDLYWIPLGAGAHAAKVSGRVYESILAARAHRPRCDLYHSALAVQVPDGRFVVEQTPVPDDHGDARGVVATGPVGLRALGRFRVFRYEIRRWRNGTIPDLAEAVGGAHRISDDLPSVRGVLDVLPRVPTPVWGRDELRAGEMWNSNSIVAWTLTRAGLDLADVRPPPGGRAPGWHAGITVARRTAPG